jgi:hypothetical protein
MNYFRQRPLSLAVQLLLLRRRFPDGNGEIHQSRLVWEQAIHPHTLAHTYRCRLEYRLGDYPQMCCLEPPLSVLAMGRYLPHVYTRTEPVHICLFMHRHECWREDMILANVVVPLAYYWLANFEEWLFSGIWRGGGTHPIDSVRPEITPVFPSDTAVIPSTVNDRRTTITNVAAA